MASNEILQELRALREEHTAFRDEQRAFREESQKHFHRLEAGVSGTATAIAEARRDIGALDEKLVRIQEALYFVGHKVLEDMEGEQLRSMLPDPPRRLASFAR